MGNVDGGYYEQHCCLCISKENGTHIIGLLMLLGLIGEVLNLAFG